MLVTTDSNESLQKFLDNQAPEYVESLIELAHTDLHEACKQLRSDACEPIMDCKKFLYTKLELLHGVY